MSRDIRRIVESGSTTKGARQRAATSGDLAARVRAEPGDDLLMIRARILVTRYALSRMRETQ